MIRNNIAYGNRGFGIQVQGIGTQNNRIHNNTTMGNGWPGYASSLWDQSIWQNNIGYQDDNIGFEPTCSFYGGTELVILDGALPTVANNFFSSEGIDDPRFVDEGANPPDLHLQSDSPAMGQGANLSPDVTDDFDGAMRPQESAYPIGAYELSGSGQ